jgi:hypothetical protein
MKCTLISPRFPTLVSLVAGAVLLAPAALGQPAPGPAAPPADTKATPADKNPDKKKDTLANRAISGRATRVAFLDFGPPPSWKGLVDDMVGVTISAKAFADVIPILEADKVDVVVVRINSGGGYTLEGRKFHSLFQDKFEEKFRTVAWVHWSMSAAAMSPWVIDEFYMETGGRIGACVQFSGAGNASKGLSQVEILELMKDASAMGGHDPKIMRSMQEQAPLSANIDEFGNVELFQDSTSGKLLINPDGGVLTLNAIEAAKIKFSRGIADNVPELMKAMNITEYEIVGEKATKQVQEFMRRAHNIDTQVGELATQLWLSYTAANSLRGENNREMRTVEVGKCKAALTKLHAQVKLNPNFRFRLPQLRPEFGGEELTDEWFAEMDRQLKRIAADK